TIRKKLYFVRGTIVQITTQSLTLLSSDLGHKQVLTFSITSRSKFLDFNYISENIVNIVYVKEETRNAIVLLQRLPSIRFDEEVPERTKGEHFGVAENAIPEDQADRILAQLPHDRKNRLEPVTDAGGGVGVQRVVLGASNASSLARLDDTF